MATVSWSAPLDDGGGVARYTVVVVQTGAEHEVDGGTLSLVVSGLNNGTSYTFTVRAGNAAGEGPSSAPSASVTPSRVPDPPTEVVAEPRNAAASVRWTAPLDNGGAPLQSYTVTSSPGGIERTVSAGSTSTTLSGLTNGTEYTCTVVATNVRGPSAASEPSNPVTPGLPPDAPQNALATPGDALIDVTWEAPLTDNGYPVLSYRVVAGTRSTVTAADVFSASFTGLQNGQSYSVTVYARSIIGEGPGSPPIAVIPSTIPDAPTDVVATATATRLFVRWAPGFDGGSAVTDFQVAVEPGGHSVRVSGLARAATVSGLDTGATYSATVQAFNANGPSPLSAAAQATTAALPRLRLPNPEQAGASTYVSALASGDLDRDGLQDVIAASQYYDAIVVYRGHGDGTYEPGVSYPVGDAPVAVIVGDFDGDGVLDVAVANQGSGTVSALRGTGDGALEPALTVPVGSSPLALAAADLDASGEDDLVVANSGGNNVHVLLGDVDFAFTWRQSYTTASGPSAVAIGDFDGGGLDIAVAHTGTSTVRLLPGDGAGGFGPVFGSFATDTAPRALLALDLDVDGDLDLAAATETGAAVSVLLGDGVGGFAARVDYTVPGNAYALRAAELTGDGLPDLIAAGQSSVSSSYGFRALLRSAGAGAFATPQTTLQYIGRLSALALDDVDQDGVVDLLRAGSGWSIEIGLGDGRFVTPTGIDVAGYRALAFGDVTGDGLADVVVVSRTVDDGTLRVYEADGLGGFSLRDTCTVLKSTSVVEFSGVYLGDFSGDGRTDIAAVDWPSRRICRWTASATYHFSGHSDTVFPAAGVDSGPGHIAVGKVNGDVYDDAVVVVSGPRQVAVLRGPSFSSRTDYLVSASIRPVRAALVDLDGDGDLDILTANSSVHSNTESSIGFSVLKNYNGAFGTAAEYGQRTAGGSGYGFRGAATADLDEDGDQDVVISTGTFGTSVFANDGTGGFGTYVDRSTGQTSGNLVAADMDGDGHQDLVFATSPIALARGLGDSSFETVRLFVGALSSQNLALGDFDADGRPDLAAGGSSHVDVMHNTCLP
ncbi:MAG: VCBS repeat-containing protein [Deltaproteobacteria bacterium]|nr:VCBS repeat-containing protein [Deltaproteobacteria bacterium]